MGKDCWRFVFKYLLLVFDWYFGYLHLQEYIWTWKWQQEHFAIGALYFSLNNLQAFSLPGVKRNLKKNAVFSKLRIAEVLSLYWSSGTAALSSGAPSATSSSCNCMSELNFPLPAGESTIRLKSEVCVVWRQALCFWELSLFVRKPSPWKNGWLRMGNTP